MSISEQVKELRDKADIFEKSGCAVDGIVRVFSEAANTIESLSAKLQAENIEHSADINENMAFKLEKLAQYEDLGVTPEQIKEIDAMYADRCREIAELRKQFGTVAGEEKAGQWKRLITDRFLKVK